MTNPSTPGDALHAAGKRLTDQREAARRMSREIAERRDTEPAEAPRETPEGTS